MTLTTQLSAVHVFPPRGKVVEEPGEYTVELDVAEFTEDEIVVDVDGSVITVTAEQTGLDERPLILRERLEESFRLPSDASPDELRVVFDEGRLELHAPRHRFALNPDATPC